MTAMPHLPAMAWDFKDQFQSADLGGGGTAFYVYDATGTRIKKVIERQNGTRQKERLYLGGLEVYREYVGTGVTLERETLHIVDGKQRIALVETCTRGNDGLPPQLVRYQFGNHLGSASLELDDAGKVISYEEYYPYGSTSYQAGRSAAELSLKRYRYTGEERDEETGFTYHGARYYAPWLGRWASCDPLWTADETNLYRYCRDRPLILVDLNGRDPVAGMYNPQASLESKERQERIQKEQAEAKVKEQPVEERNEPEAFPGARQVWGDASSREEASRKLLIGLALPLTALSSPANPVTKEDYVKGNIQKQQGEAEILGRTLFVGDIYVVPAKAIEKIGGGLLGAGSLAAGGAPKGLAGELGSAGFPGGALADPFGLEAAVDTEIAASKITYLNELTDAEVNAFFRSKCGPLYDKAMAIGDWPAGGTKGYMSPEQLWQAGWWKAAVGPFDPTVPSIDPLGPTVPSIDPLGPTVPSIDPLGPTVPSIDPLAPTVPSSLR
jgi:RHS repeat-associated protein